MVRLAARGVQGWLLAADVSSWDVVDGAEPTSELEPF
jgi:hypothetical protein